MKRKCLFSLIVAIVLVVGLGSSGAFARKAHKAPKGPTARTAPADPPPCPSGGTPASGSTVIGGLVVDGACILNNVTAHGGILVLGTGGLELENCNVTDGIVVEPGGEVDVGQPLGTGTSQNPTGNPNTISGGISIDAALDFHISGATLVDGGVTVVGTVTKNPTICGSSITGDVVFTDATMTGFIAFGDSDDAEPVFPTQQCTGNTITGSVDIINSKANLNNWFDFEQNSISGDVFVLNSTTEFGGNTVSGGATCLGSTTIINQGFATPSDIIPNVVVGNDTCKPLVDTK